MLLDDNLNSYDNDDPKEKCENSFSSLSNLFENQTFQTFFEVPSYVSSSQKAKQLTERFDIIRDAYFPYLSFRNQKLFVKQLTEWIRVFRKKEDTSYSSFEQSFDVFLDKIVEYQLKKEYRTNLPYKTFKIGGARILVFYNPYQKKWLIEGIFSHTHYLSIIYHRVAMDSFDTWWWKMY